MNEDLLTLTLFNNRCSTTELDSLKKENKRLLRLLEEIARNKNCPLTMYCLALEGKLSKSKEN